MRSVPQLLCGGSAPATPGFNAVAPEWLFYGAAKAAPAVPAAESTLGSHPCVALSSAQVLPEWINRNLAGNAFASNGNAPLNLVSHSRGSLQERWVGSRLFVAEKQFRRVTGHKHIPKLIRELEVLISPKKGVARERKAS